MCCSALSFSEKSENLNISYNDLNRQVKFGKKTFLLPNL